MTTTQMIDSNGFRVTFHTGYGWYDWETGEPVDDVDEIASLYAQHPHIQMTDQDKELLS